MVLMLCFFFTGFGYSDKPQPKYGFDYTLDGNFSSRQNKLMALLYNSRLTI